MVCLYMCRMFGSCLGVQIWLAGSGEDGPFALAEDETQVQGDSIMEEIAAKFRLSNGEVDLASPDEEPVLCSNQFRLFLIILFLRGPDLHISLYVCIYIYICIYIHMYIYICIYTYIDIDISIYTYIYISCIYSYRYMHIYIYICACLCMCIYTYMYIHVLYICVFIYMYIVYMYMHTCQLSEITIFQSFYS